MAKMAGLLAIGLGLGGSAAAQQPAQTHLYCMNGRAELRLARQSEGRSTCFIRSFGHDSTAREWVRRNLPEGGRCSCE